MNKVDFLIVGGGIAGCLMAFELMERGQSVGLADDTNRPGSSMIAAGSINPITGRRFVKSWKIDLLLESVDSIYSRIENKYNRKVLHPCKIIRGIKKTAMLNDWSARYNDPEYMDFINYGNSINCPDGIVDNYVECVSINNGYRVDFESNITLIENELKESGLLINAKVNPSSLINASVVIDVNYSKVIFTEGSNVVHNPIWNYLNFVPARGERLIISASDLKLNDTFNDGKILIPIGGDQYWFGSTYDWDNVEPVGTEQGLKELTDYLDRTLSVPYEVIDHAGHVRPATYDRRPFVGQHPEYDDFYILNGLGAKGGSLAPYCVEQLCDFILAGKDLDEEIDVAR